MTLTLDPRLPLLWRTPDSVQLGLDDPPVRLQGVSTAQERMLAALALGLTPQGLNLIGKESGLSRAQVSDFVRTIRPALVAPSREVEGTVSIDGLGPTADRLHWRLREAGVESLIGPSGLPRRVEQSGQEALVDPGRPDSLGASSTQGVSTASVERQAPAVAVLIGDFVLSPEHRGRWLRRDIPHLPIVYSDTSVTIGPFIEVGTGPCLYCLELHHRDADPAWPALASQLLGAQSSVQHPFFASEVATIAARWVLRRLLEGPADAATALTVDAETGQPRQRSWTAHPECSCTGIAVGEAGSEERRRDEVGPHALSA